MATPNFRTDVEQTEAKFDVSLKEWCMRQSEGDRRVELLGAFYREQLASGAKSASAEEFASRFERMATRPA